jgi:hypothetical protein
MVVVDQARSRNFKYCYFPKLSIKNIEASEVMCKQERDFIFTLRRSPEGISIEVTAIRQAKVKIGP